MKLKVIHGGGFRKRQLDVLPQLEIGWGRKLDGLDILVSWLCWYGYVEIWKP